MIVWQKTFREGKIYLHPSFDIGYKESYVEDSKQNSPIIMTMVLQFSEADKREWEWFASQG